jgi:hypothetical protein
LFHITRVVFFQEMNPFHPGWAFFSEKAGSGCGFFATVDLFRKRIPRKHLE